MLSFAIQQNIFEYEGFSRCSVALLHASMYAFSTICSLVLGCLRYVVSIDKPDAVIPEQWRDVVGILKYFRAPLYLRYMGNRPDGKEQEHCHV